MVFCPCCIKSLCCKDKSAKAQGKEDGREWFEPIRGKSRNQCQDSAQESVNSSFSVESSDVVKRSGGDDGSCDDESSGDDDGIENNDSAPTTSPKASIKQKCSLSSFGEEGYKDIIVSMSNAESQKLNISITGDLSESEANLMYDEDKDEV